MNAVALARLEQMNAELEDAVRENFIGHSDADLLELIDVHLNNPELVMLGAIAVKGGHVKLCAMAALAIARERLRRAEVALMEKV